MLQVSSYPTDMRDQAALAPLLDLLNHDTAANSPQSFITPYAFGYWSDLFFVINNQKVPNVQNWIIFINKSIPPINCSNSNWFVQCSSHLPTISKSHNQRWCVANEPASCWIQRYSGPENIAGCPERGSGLHVVFIDPPDFYILRYNDVMFCICSLRLPPP